MDTLPITKTLINNQVSAQVLLLFGGRIVVHHEKEIISLAAGPAYNTAASSASSASASSGAAASQQQQPQRWLHFRAKRKASWGMEMEEGWGVVGVHILFCFILRSSFEPLFISTPSSSQYLPTLLTPFSVLFRNTKKRWPRWLNFSEGKRKNCFSER